MPSSPPPLAVSYGDSRFWVLWWEGQEEDVKRIERSRKRVGQDHVCVMWPNTLSGLEAESNPTKDFTFSCHPERLLRPNQCAPITPPEMGVEGGQGTAGIHSSPHKARGAVGASRCWGQVFKIRPLVHRRPKASGLPLKPQSRLTRHNAGAVMAKEVWRERGFLSRGPQASSSREGDLPGPAPPRSPQHLGAAFGVPPNGVGSSQTGHTYLVWVTRWWNPKPWADAEGRCSTWPPTPRASGAPLPIFTMTTHSSP